MIYSYDDQFHLLNLPFARSPSLDYFKKFTYTAQERVIIISRLSSRINQAEVLAAPDPRALTDNRNILER